MFVMNSYYYLKGDFFLVCMCASEVTVIIDALELATSKIPFGLIFGLRLSNKS